MKILAFTDTHGNDKALEDVKRKIKKHNVDLAICAGDFTIFERRIKQILAKINSFGKPVLLIHGNHEEEAAARHLSEGYKNLIWLHKRFCRCQNYFFLGYGGGGFALTDPRFREWADKAIKKMKPGEKCILILHGPPYGTKTDKVMGQHCGNKDYRNFIKKNTDRIVLAVCGHLHDCFYKKDAIGRTWVINPGPYGTVIEV